MREGRVYYVLYGGIMTGILKGNRQGTLYGNTRIEDRETVRGRIFFVDIF